MVAANTATEPRLEQQLDQYKQLVTDNQTAAARQLLDTLVARLPPDTPISSKVRAHSYQLLEYTLLQQPEQAQQQANWLLQQAETTAQADAIAEALCTRLWVQMYQPEQQIFQPPAADAPPDERRD